MYLPYTSDPRSASYKYVGKTEIHAITAEHVEKVSVQ